MEKGTFSPAEANFLNATVAVRAPVHQRARSRHRPALRALRRGQGDWRDPAHDLQTHIDRDAFRQGLIEQVLHRQAGHHARDLFGLFCAGSIPSARARRAATAGRAAGARGRPRAARRHDLGDESGGRALGAGVRGRRGAHELLPPDQDGLVLPPGEPFFSGPASKVLPFGVFFIVGRSFHGFHVRFKDIARGGIRIVRSATMRRLAAQFRHAVRGVLQPRLHPEQEEQGHPRGRVQGRDPARAGRHGRGGGGAFQRYVDALLDLLAPAGPDGRGRVGRRRSSSSAPTRARADLMDWASLQARERGYRYWKAFTTGKEASLGGISHKEYGMTTQGVHRYVAGDPRASSASPRRRSPRRRPGGPDGDLGRNEILISRDRTIAIVDGGGVLCDPDGLDRAELTRLARAGLDSGSFDAARLGPKGFKVGVGDRDKHAAATGTRGRLGPRVPQHLPPRPPDEGRPVRALRRPAEIDQPRQLALAPRRRRHGPLFRWIVEGRQPLHHAGGAAEAGGEGRRAVQGQLHEQGRGDLLLPRGARRPRDGRRELRAPHVRGRWAPRRRSSGAATSPRWCGTSWTARTRSSRLLWRVHRATGRPLSVLAEEVSARINQITDEVAASSLVNDPAMRLAALRLQAPGDAGATRSAPRRSSSGCPRPTSGRWWPRPWRAPSSTATGWPPASRSTAATWRSWPRGPLPRRPRTRRRAG